MPKACPPAKRRCGCPFQTFPLPLSVIEGKPGRAAWRWRRTQPIPAMLMEDDGRWSSMGKIYCQPACKELDGKGVALAKTALMQKQMGLAA